MRRALLAAAVVAGIAVAAPGASAAGPFAPCAPNGLECATLTVPLDYAGATPGQISLHVEELPAVGTPRGVLLMLAGGPGQASAETFDLTDQGAYWQSYFPGYTLVTYDDRGTGKSGALSCAADATIDVCGNSISGHAFYTTRDHAEDIESVRLAVGADKLAVYGVSYGTKHAVAYALAHPDHVERLLLDSELLPQRDFFGLASLQTIPASVDGICAVGACPTLPSGIGEELASYSNSVHDSPVSVNVGVTPSGSTSIRIDGDQLVSLAYESDLSSGVSSQLPAAVDAALHGWTLPLARLIGLDDLVQQATFDDVNEALFLATTCGDGPFPWSPADSVATRITDFNNALDALPPGSTGIFGGWAVLDSAATECVFWPAPSGGAALGAGPLPDVPVLVLSGDRDIRTPTSGAVAIASQFPQGHVLVVPGSGHAVLERSTCAGSAVRGWLDGVAPPASCPRIALGVPPLARWRRTVAATPPAAHVTGRTGRTLAALVQTLHDAEDAWLLGRQSTSTVNGLVGGTMVPDAVKTIRLQRYSSVGGLTVTGTIILRLAANGQPVIPLAAASGTLTVSGSGSSHGTLKALGNRLTGTLGGKKISASF
ncbi:MAG TPA: alpha/beta fold hydrolase [Gaiellaceae bacterium]